MRMIVLMITTASGTQKKAKIVRFMAAHIKSIDQNMKVNVKLLLMKHPVIIYQTGVSGTQEAKKVKVKLMAAHIKNIGQNMKVNVKLSLMKHPVIIYQTGVSGILEVEAASTNLQVLCLMNAHI